jgi:hypothetical protein
VVFALSRHAFLQRKEDKRKKKKTTTTTKNLRQCRWVGQVLQYVSFSFSFFFLFTLFFFFLINAGEGKILIS